MQFEYEVILRSVIKEKHHAKIPMFMARISVEDKQVGDAGVD